MKSVIALAVTVTLGCGTILNSGTARITPPQGATVDGQYGPIEASQKRSHHIVYADGRTCVVESGVSAGVRDRGPRVLVPAGPLRRRRHRELEDARRGCAPGRHRRLTTASLAPDSIESRHATVLDLLPRRDRPARRGGRASRTRRRLRKPAMTLPTLFLSHGAPTLALANYLDIDLKYIDLSIQNRDATEDRPPE